MRKISAIQEPIWLTQQLYPKSSLYNVGGYACIEGPLKETILIKSIKQILDNTDAITIGYYAFNETPLEKNKEFILYDITTLDFSADSNPIQSCLTWMQKDIQEAFNVNQNLLKVRILKAAKDKYYWYVKVHHLVFDGYAMSLFFNTVSTLYSSRTNNKKQIYLALCKYADFIEDEENYKHSNTYKLDKAFWIDKLKDIPENKGFQTCLQSTNTESFISKRKEITISRTLYEQIENFCKEYHCTAFHYFIAVLCTLNKLYNNEDIAIGIPVFNRSNNSYKNTLGTFVNMLAFGISFADNISFIELLQQVKKELKQRYRHQHFPLYDALKELDKKGNMYNVSFSYQKNIYQPKLGNANVSIHYLHNNEQQDDLAFNLLEYSSTEDLIIAIDYKEDAFTEQVVDGLTHHYYTLIQQLYTTPQKIIKEIEYLSKAEKHQLLVEFNDTAVDYPKDKTIVDVFEEQVRRTPNNIAIVFEEKELTYKELNEQANQLAHYLRKNYKIKPDDLIGIQLKRSEWMIITILGVLKSGGACVPIDPEYPKERTNYIIDDSKCKLVIDEKELTKYKKEENKYGTKNLKSIAKSTDLAYVIYTSGSTGQPKGVTVEHASLIDKIITESKLLDINQSTKTCLVTNSTFDVSLLEIFLPITNGGCITIPSRDVILSAKSIIDFLELNKVALLQGALTFIYHLLSSLKVSSFSKLESLKCVCIGGESLSTKLVEELQKALLLTIINNHYGPTETTIDAIVASNINNFSINNIGKPLPNTKVYILNENNHLLPIGVMGEICISGPSLSKGYLNQPKLTKEKFISNPFNKKERIYKTGDLGRWLPDGSIEFICRKDDQVKIRGYRIELGEIETILKTHPSINEAVVLFNDISLDFIDYEIDTAAYDTKQIDAFLSIQKDKNASIFLQLLNKNQFDVKLTIHNNTFIKTPQENQHNWIISRFVDELKEDLLHLGKLTDCFVEGSARETIVQEWEKSEAKYSEEELIIEGQQVMQTWERPLMKRMADIATESHGDVLEIGFGMGKSASYMLERGVKSYTLIECNEDVIEKFNAWRKQYPNIPTKLVKGKWQEVDEQLGMYDAIFFDTYPLDEEEFVDHVINNITFAEHFFPTAYKHLRTGGIFTYYTNEIDSFSSRHQRLVFNYFDSFALSVVSPLHPPVDCNYWWADSMVAIKAVKSGKENLIQTLDAQIDRASQAYAIEIELLQSIPGVGKDSAVNILSEVGAGMSVFTSEHHLTSWAGMSPGNNESGGKKSTRTIHGNKYLQATLVECGWGATRKKDGYLKRKYENLVSRRGKKKALVAVGHKIIIGAYHIIKNKEAYKEPIINESSKRKTKKIKSYLNKLKALGVEVELKQAS